MSAQDDIGFISENIFYEPYQRTAKEPKRLSDHPIRCDRAAKHYPPKQFSGLRKLRDRKRSQEIETAISNGFPVSKIPYREDD